jgi:hypothetical protein
MSTITDTDLQQLKDLITAGNTATQKQITDGNAATQKQITDGNAATQKQIAESAINIQKQIAGVEVAVVTLEGKINTVNAELTIIKSNQKAQDTRFWSLVFLILTTSIGAIGKLAKFY